MGKKCIVIPAYNEEKRILKTLKDYDSTLDADIIVVFDGTDRTDEVVINFRKKAKNKIYLLKYNRRLGKGGAVYAGLKFAIKQGYKHILLADADLSVSHIYLGRMLKVGIQQHADLVLGKRYIIGYPFLRLLFSKFYHVFINLLFFERLYLGDTQCGYKYISSRLAKLYITSFNPRIHHGFSFDILISYLTKKYHLNTINYPLIWTFNSEESKVGCKAPIRVALKMLYEVTKIRFYHSPLRFVVT